MVLETEWVGLHCTIGRLRRSAASRIHAIVLNNELGIYIRGFVELGSKNPRQIKDFINSLTSTLLGSVTIYIVSNSIQFVLLEVSTNFYDNNSALHLL